MLNYAFYVSAGINIDTSRGQIDNLTYVTYMWRPGLTNIFPPGLLEIKYLVWWLLHYLMIFSNRAYCVLLILDKDKTLIHRSSVFPRYFRFPFMKNNDLQIGDTFTDEKYRGKGIAAYAIQKIVELCKVDNRKFWYIVEENNKSSIRVIEKVGFNKIGCGERRKKFGLQLFGSFEILTKI